MLNRQTPPSNGNNNVAIMPWSVKGVSDEARAIAKMKAQEKGQTIGAWLSDVIMQSVATEAPARSVSVPVIYSAPAGQGSAQDNPAMQQAINELSHLLFAVAKRVATLENDTVEFAASFQDQLSDVRRKLQMMQNV